MKMAKPFLKWAGGKTQLINNIHSALPGDVLVENFTYIEPFVGSGAVLFRMLNTFPQIKKAVINDINEDLINTYRTIASKPEELIAILEELQDDYLSLEEHQEKKKEYYYARRTQFNARTADDITQASLFIFLNRTCFNGLYRVNRQNQFNVPMGSYKRPTICDSENICAVSKALQKVEILCGDFEATLNHAGPGTFFYFDPPYKPLNQTSSFNSYARDEFNDTEQTRLRDFCKKIDHRGSQWMLSNSDVRGHNPEDNFFDDLYSDFLISRVKARRSINSNSAKRGELNELLITNYEYEPIAQ